MNSPSRPSQGGAGVALTSGRGGSLAAASLANSALAAASSMTQRPTASTITSTTTSPQQTSTSSFQQQTAAMQMESRVPDRGPPSVFVLTSAPRRVSLMHLSEIWAFPLFSTYCDGWGASFLCCHRFHLLGQYEVLASMPTVEEIDEYERRGRTPPLNADVVSPWMLPCLCLTDAATGGLVNPLCGVGYSGVASAFLGCQVRTMIRKRFHIMGSGVDDFFLSLCCASFTARQHQREMLEHDLVYTNIPFAAGSGEMR